MHNSYWCSWLYRCRKWMRCLCTTRLILLTLRSSLKSRGLLSQIKCKSNEKQVCEQCVVFWCDWLSGWWLDAWMESLCWQLWRKQSRKWQWLRAIGHETLVRQVMKASCTLLPPLAPVCFYCVPQSVCPPVFVHIFCACIRVFVVVVVRWLVYSSIRPSIHPSINPSICLVLSVCVCLSVCRCVMSVGTLKCRMIWILYRDSLFVSVIAKRRIGLPAGLVQRYINNMDLDGLCADHVELLLKFIPTKDEVSWGTPWVLYLYINLDGVVDGHTDLRTDGWVAG